MSNLCQGPSPDCKGMLHLIVPHICFHQQEGYTGMKQNCFFTDLEIYISDGLHPPPHFRTGDVTPSQKWGVTALPIKSPPSASSFSSKRSMLKCIHTGQGLLSCSFTSQQAVPLLTLEHTREMGREHSPVARNEALLSYMPWH